MTEQQLSIVERDEPVVLGETCPDCGYFECECQAEPGPPPVQLGLDVDVPIAIKLPRGQGTAYQDPLGS